MSFGWYAESKLLHDAIKYAYDSGVLLIAAAGNVTIVSLLWNPTIEDLYNLTVYVVPVASETNFENNVLQSTSMLVFL